MGVAELAGNGILGLAYLAAFLAAGYAAYQIRIYAITTYGYVIHEFDPWFNFRATKYLAENGWHAFFHWFDYKVWYPLGRPVGTTIYPGMQITSVCIWKVLGWIGKLPVLGSIAMSLNDVCCLVPAWFGVTASWALGALTAECSGSWTAGAAAALIMSVVPAHIMRSVAGGYDNESIALTAMCTTFYCWVRALRHDPKAPEAAEGGATRDSVVYGILAGIAYIYMVAAWGGFVFVLNMIGVHAAALVLLGRFTSKLHRAYSLFYLIGTIGATRVPVVGWNPLKALEQLAPLLVFLGFQLLEACEVQRRKRKLTMAQHFLLRVKAAIPAAAALALVVFILYPTGYFGPLSARVRGLFVKHTRTGNPLVDSVAEHQPANDQAYQHYLHNIYSIAPFGLGLSALHWSDANLFLVLYALVAYYFSNKMARLIILLGPVASALGGVAVGIAADQLLLRPLAKLLGALCRLLGLSRPAAAATAKADKADKEDKAKAKDKAKEKKEKEDKEDKAKAKDKAKEKKEEKEEKEEAKGAAEGGTQSLNKALEHLQALRELLSEVIDVLYNNKLMLLVRIAVGVYLAMQAWPQATEFYEYSHQIAESLSQPQIMFKARLYNGQEVMVDDYREAYWWLRDHTPEDARVMAWWDYGYQITGIGERTTIADGNTWNHEHIATLGLILSASEEKAHSIARHLADYVLVWAGGGGDDLAKSPHMARIGNSVYRDICPGDPTCSKFGFYQGGQPTAMMKKCLLYKMVQHGHNGIFLNETRFKHVYTTKFGKVRIFKIRSVSLKSKKWVADPANRICDAPGSWYCTGQYPPALKGLIARRKPFKQLEDFNVEGDDDAYQKEYHRRMDGIKGGKGAEGAGGPKEGGGRRPLGLKYLGCVGAEAELGARRTYEGGPYGANIELARNAAKEGGARYFAIARSGADGHLFLFNELPTSLPQSLDAGCDVPCLDFEDYKCGCADGNCGGLKPVAGEDNVRRWAVYEVKKRTKGSRRAKEEL